MRKSLLASAVLLPALAIGTALPAQAGTSSETFTLKAQAVDTVYYPNAAPLRALRSSTQTCSGTLAYKKVLVSGGKVYGELDVYTKAGNSGTAIACFKHAGVTAHKRLPTSVAIVTAKSVKSSTPAVVVTAYGRFISYAGPVAVGGVKGHCVVAAGAVKVSGKAYTVESPVLCGK